MEKNNFRYQRLECIFAKKDGCQALDAYYCYERECKFFKSKYEYDMDEDGYVTKKEEESV